MISVCYCGARKAIVTAFEFWVPHSLNNKLPSNYASPTNAASGLFLRGANREGVSSNLESQGLIFRRSHLVAQGTTTPLGRES